MLKVPLGCNKWPDRFKGINREASEAGGNLRYIRRFSFWREEVRLGNHERSAQWRASPHTPDAPPPLGFQRLGPEPHSNKNYDQTTRHQCLQFSSVAQSCPTLCDPMNRSTPGLPVHHQLPKLTQTHVHRVGDAIQPSHPRSSPSSPAPNPSQHQSLFQ